MARGSRTSAAQTAPEPAGEPSLEEAVAEGEFEVLGDMPAFALAESYVGNSQALGLAAHNAVASQQKLSTEAMTATMAGVAKIRALDPASASSEPTTSPTEPNPSQKEA